MSLAFYIASSHVFIVMLFTNKLCMDLCSIF